MVSKCDVLVIGAGPAGLSTAITTSHLGLETIVIEKNSEIGEYIKSSALTWRDVIDEWNISKKSIARWYNKFRLVSFHSKKEVIVPFRDYICCTLNFEKFLVELSKKCVKSKTIFLMNKKVGDLNIRNGKEVEVELNDGKKIKSKIIVDASGLSAVIARKLGLVPKHFELGVGMEYELSNAKIEDPERFDIFVGEREVIPIGYGWSFPVGKDKTRIGVGTSIIIGKDKKVNIKNSLNKFISKNSQVHSITKDSKKIETHSGSYPLGGFFDKTYADNVLVVGDAAGHASPLFAEGIRYALKFGKFAGNIVFDAISNKNLFRDYLAVYQAKCKNYIKDYYDVIFETSEIPTDTFWDTLIDTFEALKNSKRDNLIIKILRNEISKKEAENLGFFKRMR